MIPGQSSTDNHGEFVCVCVNVLKTDLFIKLFIRWFFSFYVVVHSSTSNGGTEKDKENANEVDSTSKPRFLNSKRE